MPINDAVLDELGRRAAAGELPQDKALIVQELLRRREVERQPVPQVSAPPPAVPPAPPGLREAQTSGLREAQTSGLLDRIAAIPGAIGQRFVDSLTGAAERPGMTSLFGSPTHQGQAERAVAQERGRQHVADGVVQATVRDATGDIANTGIDNLPMVGEAVGRAVAPGPLKPIGGAIGAAGGELGRQVLRGEEIRPGRIALEGALSVVPDALIGATRYGVRSAAVASDAGQAVLRQEAVNQAAEVPTRVFRPPAKAVVDRQFAMVRASGVKIDITPARETLALLDDGQQQALRQTIAGFDRAGKTGGKYVRLYDNLIGQASGPRVVGVDIGDLQGLRSQLGDAAMKRPALTASDFEARDLLYSARDAIDDSIDAGLARGVTPTAGTTGLLKEARKGHATLRATENLGALFAKHTRSLDNGAGQAINLDGFLTELARGSSGLSRRVNRSLTLTPDARRILTENLAFMQKTLATGGAGSRALQKVMQSGLLGGAAGAGGYAYLVLDAGAASLLGPGVAVAGVFAPLLLSKSFPSFFRRLVLDQGGVLTRNVAALALNTLRREGLQIESFLESPDVTEQRQQKGQ